MHSIATHLKDVVEDDDGLAPVGGVGLAPDLPEPLDLRGAEADDLARQRPPPRAAARGGRRGDVGPAAAQDARRHHTLCERQSRFKFRARVSMILNLIFPREGGATIDSSLTLKWGSACQVRRTVARAEL